MISGISPDGGGGRAFFAGNAGKIAAMKFHSPQNKFLKTKALRGMRVLRVLFKPVRERNAVGYREGNCVFCRISRAKNYTAIPRIPANATSGCVR